MKTTVGILGSGPVAQALGSGLLKYGYDVMLGTRDTTKLLEWKEKKRGESRHLLRHCFLRRDDHPCSERQPGQFSP